MDPFDSRLGGIDSILNSIQQNESKISRLRTEKGLQEKRANDLDEIVKSLQLKIEIMEREKMEMSNEHGMLKQTRATLQEENRRLRDSQSTLQHTLKATELNAEVLKREKLECERKCAAQLEKAINANHERRQFLLSNLAKQNPATESFEPMKVSLTLEGEKNRLGKENPSSSSEEKELKLKLGEVTKSNKNLEKHLEELNSFYEEQMSKAKEYIDHCHRKWNEEKEWVCSNFKIQPWWKEPSAHQSSREDIREMRRSPTSEDSNIDSAKDDSNKEGNITAMSGDGFSRKRNDEDPLPSPIQLSSHFKDRSQRRDHFNDTREFNSKEAFSRSNSTDEEQESRHHETAKAVGPVTPNGPTEHDRSIGSAAQASNESVLTPSTPYHSSMQRPATSFNNSVASITPDNRPTPLSESGSSTGPKESSNIKNVFASPLSNMHNESRSTESRQYQEKENFPNITPGIAKPGGKGINFKSFQSKTPNNNAPTPNESLKPPLGPNQKSPGIGLGLGGLFRNRPGFKG